MKDVTAAIIIHDHKILIAKRSPDQHLAGMWEFPGGKIEIGETPEECLIREIQEEFDVTIGVDGFFCESIFSYQTGRIRLLGYKAKWITGDFNLKVHSQIRWIRQTELNDFAFAPADITFVEKLKKEWV